ncbi:MAG: peroxide stress protein YaaA, partial [Pseudomonadota bacterium]|nr:peroxide stress protein YaaA [Pseudomonadota bacterium]
MLVVISPAKRLDWAERQVDMTEPAFGEDAMRLAKTMRNLTLGDLKGLMDLSDDLAKLNRDRFKSYAAEPDADAVRPAALRAYVADRARALARRRRRSSSTDRSFAGDFGGGEAGGEDGGDGNDDDYSNYYPPLLLNILL